MEGIEEHGPIEMKGIAVGMLGADFFGSIGFEQAIDSVFMVLKFMKNLFGDAVNRHHEQQQHTQIPLYFNPHAANIAFAGEIGNESLKDYFEGIQKEFYNIKGEIGGIQWEFYHTQGEFEGIQGEFYHT